MISPSLIVPSGFITTGYRNSSVKFFLYNDKIPLVAVLALIPIPLVIKS